MCFPCRTTGNQDGCKECVTIQECAQAQGQDPDIGPVVDQLSPELKEPTDKELQPLSRATYKGNLGKLELLVLRE